MNKNNLKIKLRQHKLKFLRINKDEIIIWESIW
jgi:hypothetical protein